MTAIIAWALANWGVIAAAILLLDKIVAITPTKYDDMILTSIKAILGALTGKGK